MVTPFKKDRSVDYNALEKLCSHLIEGGVDYLVVQGTTGESATLTKQEKHDVLRAVVQAANKRVPVVFGHGGNNTHALIDAFADMDLSGVDALLSASPYYNKPTQTGIIAHYQALAEASPRPLILYNVPGRTSSNMLASTTLELAKNGNIIAVKEASGNLDQVGAIIKDRPEGFLVLSGDDPLVVPHIALGGEGIVSVVGNAFPRQFTTLVNAALEGNYEEARRGHYVLIELVHALFAEGNPGGVKAALNILGVCEDHVRLPLAPVSKELYSKLESLIKTIENAA